VEEAYAYLDLAVERVIAVPESSLQTNHSLVTNPTYQKCMVVPVNICVVGLQKFRSRDAIALFDMMLAMIDGLEEAINERTDGLVDQSDARS
jgi:hypothetical protein